MKFPLALLLMLASGCMTIVDAGNRGIMIDTGEIKEGVLKEGFYMYGPFHRVEEVSIRVRTSTTETAAASRDMQKVHAKLVINWLIPEAKVIEVFRNLGDAAAIEDRVIDSAVSEILKAETAKMTAEEILTKRMELKKSIDDAVTQRLAYFGLQVEAVNLSDFGFTGEFDKAVEAKQIAEQRAKQAHYEAQQATQQATADIERAKGQAEAQKLLKSSLTSDLIQKLAIEKWDGHLPTYLNGQPPLITLPAGVK